MANIRVLVGDTLIAEAPVSDVVRVEGNPYLPPSALKEAHTTPSDLTTFCGWKGTAKYLNVVTPDGRQIANAVWYYPDPKPAANNIKGYYAFYPHKVDIKED